MRRRLVLRRGSLSVEQQHDTPPEPEREAPSSEAERLEAEHVLVEPLHLVLGLLEEDARTRRLDKSRRGRLAAFWLASGPADSATIDSSPAGFLRRRAWAKHAICEVSGRVLQSSCLQSGRGWGDNSRVLRRAVRTTSRRKDGLGRKALFLRQQKQSPTPRLRVGRGGSTDLVFPDASDRRRKRGGGA